MHLADAHWAPQVHQHITHDPRSRLYLRTCALAFVVGTEESCWCDMWSINKCVQTCEPYWLKNKTMYNFCICCAAWVHTFTFMTMPSECIQASPNQTHQWVKRSRVWFGCTKQGWRERDLKLFQDRNNAVSLPKCSAALHSSNWSGAKIRGVDCHWESLAVNRKK